MNQSASVKRIEAANFVMELFIDPYNKRIRVDDYRGNIHKAISRAEALSEEMNAEKLIIKGRREHFFFFLESGYLCEAVIDHYFLGTDAYFFSKFFTVERKRNDHWIAEDSINKAIYQLQTLTKQNVPPEDYMLTKMDTADAESLARLYREVFQVYPTPLDNAQYIRKTIEAGTIYIGFRHNGEIVSAASAEVNHFYKNAELTDCATLTAHRKHGLMKLLLKKLEEELKGKGIFCAYSIARSLSFGMNAVFYQLGYAYRGRLMNNCYIYDKLENMNVWVKDLAAMPDFRH